MTRSIQPSLSSTKQRLRDFTYFSFYRDVEMWVSRESPSGQWYALATDTSRHKVDTSTDRRTFVALHRLGLGYHCTTRLNREEIVPRECEHCSEEQEEPVLRYILECSRTRRLLPNPRGLSAPALIQSTSDATLLALVRLYTPPC